MERRIKRRLRTLITAYILICVTSIAGILFLNHHALDYSREYMSSASLSMLEDQLVERVNNLVIRIDNQRIMTYQNAEMLCTWIITHTQNDNDYAASLQDWINILSKTENGRYMQLILCTPEGCMYYHDGTCKNIRQYDGEALQAYVTTDSVYRMANTESGCIAVFAKRKDLDESVLQFTRSLIYSSDFGSDGYAWVNKILHYSGGDNFAIRLIHPTLRDEEGSYLSTNTQDAKGNQPLLTELNGLKASGKIMHHYFLKKPGSHHVQEKVAYTVLYEPYDWAISSGEPLANVNALVADAWSNTQTAICCSTAIVIAVFLLSSVVTSILVYRTTQKLKTSVDDYVFKETKLDSLTGAFTRSGGTPLLTADWKQARLGSEPLLIMVMDVDNFKLVNDTYGHDIGDLVLKNICAKVKSCTRQSDYIIRLGGEEFVIVCKNVAAEQVHIVADKILSAIRTECFTVNSTVFHVSVSLGAALTCADDHDFQDTLKRADQALYQAKNTGKDHFVIAEEFLGSML